MNLMQFGGICYWIEVVDLSRLSGMGIRNLYKLRTAGTERAVTVPSVWLFAWLFDFVWAHLLWSGYVTTALWLLSTTVVTTRTTSKSWGNNTNTRSRMLAPGVGWLTICVRPVSSIRSLNGYWFRLPAITTGAVGNWRLTSSTQNLNVSKKRLFVVQWFRWRVESCDKYAASVDECYWS